MYALIGSKQRNALGAGGGGDDAIHWVGGKVGWEVRAQRRYLKRNRENVDVFDKGLHRLFQWKALLNSPCGYETRQFDQSDGRYRHAIRTAGTPNCRVCSSRKTPRVEIHPSYDMGIKQDHFSMS